MNWNGIQHVITHILLMVSAANGVS